jgi:hypothetical protein
LAFAAHAGTNPGSFLRPAVPARGAHDPRTHPHRFWNERSEDARSRQFFRPALDTAYFFETLFSLARHDQLHQNGMPKLLPLVTRVRQFGDEIRPVSPPWLLLRTIAVLLTPLARGRNYTATLEY